MPQLMDNIRDSRGGIVGYILIILAVVIVLGYFGFDLRGIIESPQVQENLQYVWNIIKPPVVWVWDLVKGIWDMIVNLPDRFGDNFEDIAPKTRLENFEGQGAQ